MLTKSTQEILSLTSDEIYNLSETQRKLLEDRIQGNLKKQNLYLNKNSKFHFQSEYYLVNEKNCIKAEGDIINAIEWAFANKH